MSINKPPAYRATLFYTLQMILEIAFVEVAPEKHSDFEKAVKRAVSLIRSGVNVAYPDPACVDPYATAPKVDSAVIAAQVKDQNQRQAVKSMIDAVTTLIIAGPLYVYHWRLARK